MSENWSEEELEAAVIAYVDMRNKEAQGDSFTKKSYYVDLAARFDRTEKSFEFRMQNISYVYSLMGRRWVTGLKPAKNVGTRVAGEIESLICKIEGQSLPKVAAFQTAVNVFKLKKNITPPLGTKKPTRSNPRATQYNRDPSVVAWVLSEANGTCESCGNAAPFIKDDGSPFLEVHHLRLLADGGSDTITNAVAVCPNCHREFHYGKNKVQLLNNIYSNLDRLIVE